MKQKKHKSYAQDLSTKNEISNNYIKLLKNRNEPKVNVKRSKSTIGKNNFMQKINEYFLIEIFNLEKNGLFRKYTFF